MKIKRRGFGKRVAYSVAALSLAVAAIAPGFTGHASAGQITTRSIEMSSSTASATGVTYNVTFTPSGTADTRGIVVDICDNTPIIGDTSCTYPTGFNFTASPTVTFTSGIITTGWTSTGVQGGAGAGSYQALKLSNSGATSPTGGAINFTITNASMSNPSTANHSFYARIITFDTTANMANYTISGATRAGTFTGMVDYGGIALSTGTVINITARVMESLAFCVYNTTCGDDPSFTLGHGTNNVLDSTATDTKTAKFSISTNAQSGADIRFKGDTLKSGPNDIDAKGTTPGDITPGTEAFGFYISTLGANVSATSPYASTSPNYVLDTNGTTGITSTYGQKFADLSGPTNSSVTTLTFGASASNTTAAGIYTAAEQLIATGKF